MPFLFVPLKMPCKLVKKNGTVDVKTKKNPSPPKKKPQNKFSCLNEPLFFIKCFI